MTAYLLDRWRHLLTTPQTLELPRMELLARDNEPSIVVGAGTVEISSPNAFSYTLSGQPSDISYCLRSLSRQKENPYDGLMRFRLIATDLEDRQVAGGWTIPELFAETADWKFSGDLEGLHFDDRTEVSQHGGVELLFLIPKDHQASLYLGRFTSVDGDGAKVQRRHVLNVSGIDIEFRFEPNEGRFWVKAIAAPSMNHPYLENWLGEPLRILFGQLIYPRLVARIFADGRANIDIRRSPPWYKRAGWAALWTGEGSLTDKAGFWDTYSRLLSHIASARNKQDNPNFEAHKITTLYQEVVQATVGSRWVWAMTFASSIEALVLMVIPAGTRKLDSDDAAIADLCAHIGTWNGPDGMKTVAAKAVERLAFMGTLASFRQLRDEGVVTQEQVKAWDEVRNSVMHGSLVSPYSSAEEDQKLLALSKMFHALTRRVLTT